MNEPQFDRYVLESMRSGVITVNLQGEITLINGNALRILEISADPEQLLGKPAPEVLQDHEYIWQLLLEAFKSRHLPNRAEMVISGLGREGKNIGFTLSLVRDDRESVIGSAIFFKDLTQIEQLEEGQRLKKRLAALGQMAAGLAHEIRNPLAGIEVTAGLLRRRLGPEPEDTSQLDAIISEVGKLNEIVTSCLDFVRPLHLNLVPADFESILDDALVNIEALLKEQGVRLERDYCGDLAPALIDPLKIGQVFLNLFRNASQAMQNVGEDLKDSVLTIRTRVVPVDPDARTLQLTDGRVRLEDLPREGEDYVQIEIADSGCGMDSSTMDKIFYPFFTTKESGSGIGLAVAQKIVAEHFGFIDVESQPNAGATFTLKFPVGQRD